jgi:hypothetical protein
VSDIGYTEGDYDRMAEAEANRDQEPPRCDHHHAPLVCGECGIRYLNWPSTRVGGRVVCTDTAKPWIVLHDTRAVHRIVECGVCGGSEGAWSHQWSARWEPPLDHHRFQPVERDTPCGLA